MDKHPDAHEVEVDTSSIELSTSSSDGAEFSLPMEIPPQERRWIRRHSPALIGRAFTCACMLIFAIMFPAILLLAYFL